MKSKPRKETVILLWMLAASLCFDLCLLAFPLAHALNVGLFDFVARHPVLDVVFPALALAVLGASLVLAAVGFWAAPKNSWRLLIWQPASLLPAPLLVIVIVGMVDGTRPFWFIGVDAVILALVFLVLARIKKARAAGRPAPGQGQG